jgi:cell division protein FtsB
MSDQTYQRSATVNELERVRDILFGETARSYDERLDSLKRYLDDLKAEVTQLTAATSAQNEAQSQSLVEAQHALSQSLQQMQQEILAAIARLEDQKVNRYEFGRALIQLGESMLTGQPTPSPVPDQNQPDQNQPDESQPDESQPEDGS